MRRGSLQVLPDGPRVPITGDTRVGRGQRCELRIDSAFISREHTLVFVRDGEYWMRDLDSSCGTWLERGGARPVRVGAEVRLEDGDVFVSAKSRVRFSLDSGPDGA